MSGLPTGHVGDLAAALVDDQLDDAMRDLVLRHMIGCVMCRHDVEEQRLLKARLRSLAEPGLPLSLFSRLSALSESPAIKTAPIKPAVITPPVMEASPAPALIEDRSLGHTTFARESRESHRGRRMLAGAASLLLVGVGAGFAAASDGQTGSPSQRTAVLTSSNSTSAADGTEAAGSREDKDAGSFSDPAFSAMTASFSR